MDTHCSKERLESLLSLAEENCLSGDEVVELSLILDDCARVAVRLLRTHCRNCAPDGLRLRILSSFPHRTA